MKGKLVNVICVLMSFLLVFSGVTCTASSGETVSSVTDSVIDNTSSSVSKFISVGSIIDCEETAYTFTEAVDIAPEFLTLEGTTDDADISGIVYDIDTGNMISGATVEIVELQRTVVTDQDGRFSFVNVPTGNYSVSTSCVGYVNTTFDNMTVEQGVGLNLFSLCLSSEYDINGVNEVEPEESIDYLSWTNDTAPINDNSIYLQPFTLKYNNRIYALEYQEYLYHVVSVEISKKNGLTYSENLELFKAQAVAARSATNYYATEGKSVHASQGYTLCVFIDGINLCCQSYNPFITNMLSVQAVNETENEILIDSKTQNLFYAYYCSECLGHTVDGTAEDHSDEIVDNILGISDCPCDGVSGEHHYRGMCQEGATVMAGNGNTYKNILYKYYSNSVAYRASISDYTCLKVGETVSLAGKECVYLYVNYGGSYVFELYDYSQTEDKMSICIRNKTGQLIHSETAASDGEFFSIHASLPSGLYIIEAFCETMKLQNNSLSMSLEVQNAKMYNGLLELNYVWDSTQMYFEFTPTYSGYYTIKTMPVELLESDGHEAQEMNFKNANFSDKTTDTCLRILNPRTNNVLASNDNFASDNLFSSINLFLKKGEKYHIQVFDKKKDNAISCILKIYHDIDISTYPHYVSRMDFINTLEMLALAYDTEYNSGSYGGYNMQTGNFRFDDSSLISAVASGWNGDTTDNINGGATDTRSSENSKYLDSKRSVFHESIDLIFAENIEDVSNDMSTVIAGEILYTPGLRSRSGVYIGNNKVVVCNEENGVCIKNFVASEWLEHGKLNFIDYEKSDIILSPAPQICLL